MQDYVNNLQDFDNTMYGFDITIEKFNYIRWHFDNVVQYIW